MWFNILKTQPNKLNEILNFKEIKKKISLFNEQKIKNTLKGFVFFKNQEYFLKNNTNIKLILVYYLSLKKILTKNSLKYYNHILILKLTKQQLYINIFNKKKSIWFFTNGMLIKKLVLQKSKKKDNRVSILNLKNAIEFLKKKNINNVIINIIYSKTFILKYLNVLKKNLSFTKCIYIYTPGINYSKLRFKKIKSIKRKLKKKYTYNS